jgi:hypothetical protein
MKRRTAILQAQASGETFFIEQRARFYRWPSECLCTKEYWPRRWSEPLFSPDLLEPMCVRAGNTGMSGCIAILFAGAGRDRHHGAIIIGGLRTVDPPRLIATDTSRENALAAICECRVSARYRNALRAHHAQLRRENYAASIRRDGGRAIKNFHDVSRHDHSRSLCLYCAAQR